MPSARGIALAVTAIWVAVAISPAPAGATVKKDKYAGPIDLPQIEQGDVRTVPASIEFKLKSKSKKKKKKKFVPKSIFPVKTHAVYSSCSDGSRQFIGNSKYDPAEDEFDFLALAIGFEIKVKKRRFSVSDTETFDLGSETVAVTGKVPRKKPATGTIRFTDHTDAIPDPSFPTPAIDCDTGVLSWTAEKR